MNYYWNYIGEGKFAICKNCGKLVPVTSFNVVYCDMCAREIELMKHRERQKKYEKSKT